MTSLTLSLQSKETSLSALTADHQTLLTHSRLELSRRDKAHSRVSHRLTQLQPNLLHLSILRSRLPSVLTEVRRVKADLQQLRLITQLEGLSWQGGLGVWEGVLTRALRASAEERRRREDERAQERREREEAEGVATEVQQHFALLVNGVVGRVRVGVGEMVEGLLASGGRQRGEALHGLLAVIGEGGMGRGGEVGRTGR